MSDVLKVWRVIWSKTVYFESEVEALTKEAAEEKAMEGSDFLDNEPTPVRCDEYDTELEFVSVRDKPVRSVDEDEPKLVGKDNDEEE